MKTLPMIVGLVAAGAVGALAATISQPTPEVAAGTAPAPTADPRIDELVAVVARLERELLEVQTAQSSVARSPKSRAMDEAPPIRTSTGIDAPAAAGPKDPKFNKAVADAVAEVRKKEMNAIGQMWSDRVAQREKDMLDRFAKDHNLTNYQREEMGKIMTTRREELGPLYRAMFTPAEDGKRRNYTKIQEDMDKIRDASDEEMKSLLSLDQYEAFAKEEEDRRGRWGMGRSRRSSEGDNKSGSR